MASYTIEESKSYAQPEAAVFAAAQGAVEGLQGKLLSVDEAGKLIEAKFDKKIHGKVLGDRTQFFIQIESGADAQTRVAVEGYPVNVVGQKMTFGARKGVTRTVMDWFWAHLEHRLPK